MSLYKFEPNDILFNRIETHPRVKFVLHTSSVIYNDKVNECGITDGEISLGELSTLKGAGADVYQFITKGSSRIGWKTVGLSAFNNTYDFGDIMSSSLPMTSSIQNQYFYEDSTRLHVDALENISNGYKVLSNHYAFDSSLGDKGTQELRLFSFPSIFYGSNIVKGTVNLDFYVTGSLIGRLQDKDRNGNLIQTAPSGSTGSGSVGGVVYYNEGFILLTGSWDITTAHIEEYINGAPEQAPRWIDFGATGSSPTATVSSSYEMEMSGTQYVPVITMLAHADKADLNHSNNPTYIKYGQTSTISNPYNANTGSLGYYEKDDIKIKNVAKYPYNNDTGSFKKETYISKIGIYDDDKNLIGIAKLATPVRKRENDQFTFKLKMDI